MFCSNYGMKLGKDIKTTDIMKKIISAKPKISITTIIFISFLIVSSKAYAEKLNLSCTYYSKTTEDFYSQNYIVDTIKNTVKLIYVSGESKLIEGKSVKITDDIIKFKFINEYKSKYTNYKSLQEFIINRNTGVAYMTSDSNYGYTTDNGKCEKTSKKF